MEQQTTASVRVTAPGNDRILRACYVEKSGGYHEIREPDRGCLEVSTECVVLSLEVREYDRGDVDACISDWLGPCARWVGRSRRCIIDVLLLWYYTYRLLLRCVYCLLLTLCLLVVAVTRRPLLPVTVQ